MTAVDERPATGPAGDVADHLKTVTIKVRRLCKVNCVSINQFVH